MQTGVLSGRNINLILFLFFQCVNIINTSYQISIGDIEKMKYLLLVNSVLSIPFLLLHFFKIINTKITIIIILVVWAIFRIYTFNGNMIDHSIMLSYAICLILMETKIKIMPILIILFCVFSLSVGAMIYSNGNIARLGNNVLLIIVICVVHITIYYKEFTKKPDLSITHHLSKDEIDIINQIITFPSPSTKEIADNLNKKPSTILSKLDRIYNKFNLPNSGNRKLDLILKLQEIKYLD